MVNSLLEITGLKQRAAQHNHSADRSITCWICVRAAEMKAMVGAEALIAGWRIPACQKRNKAVGVALLID
jgi:hypothetical protein